MKSSLTPITRFPGVFKAKRGRHFRYYVQAASRKTFFDEMVVRQGNHKYREVDPSRSKLFASIAQGISQLGLKEDSSVLYLGASHGYTVSFLADMLTKGEIYALDFAPRVLRDLVFLCEAKENILPIYADANQVDTYSYVPQVDVVFMDIAQRDQVGIFLKNCKKFLKKGGFGLLALKARSVDVTKKPKDIFKLIRSQLEREAVVVDYRELAPYEMDHAFFVIKQK